MTRQLIRQLSLLRTSKNNQALSSNFILFDTNERARDNQVRLFGSRQNKKVKGKNISQGSGRLSENEEITNILVACLDASPRGEPEELRTKEELKRREEIVKAYTRGRFEEHNASEHDLSCKWKLKEFAIDAIPEGFLKDDAMKVNEDSDSLPPLWRRHALHTPPIPGFNISDWIDNDENDTKKN